METDLSSSFFLRSLDSDSEEDRRSTLLMNLAQADKILALQLSLLFWSCSVPCILCRTPSRWFGDFWELRFWSNTHHNTGSLVSTVLIALQHSNGELLEKNNLHVHYGTGSDFYLSYSVPISLKTFHGVPSFLSVLSSLQIQALQQSWWKTTAVTYLFCKTSLCCYLLL